MIEELRILLVRCYGGGGGGRSPLRGTRRISFFIMANGDKPVGSSQPANNAQEQRQRRKELWRTFRKLQPEYRQVIKKLAAYKRTPVLTFYEDMLNRSMLKMSKYRVDESGEKIEGTEYVRLGYINTAEILLSYQKDKRRWIKWQDVVLRDRLRNYWAGEFTKNAVSDEGLEWMLNASLSDLPIMPTLFDSDRKVAKEDRARMRHLLKELKKYSKFRDRKPSRENLKLYSEIDKEHKKLLKLGAHSGWRTAVNIVARKHGQESAPLYKRFMKYKNRLYAK
ncbi:MAG: hypothetical protein WBW16_10815 [Bacteroidota bacterium]